MSARICLILVLGVIALQVNGIAASKKDKGKEKDTNAARIPTILGLLANDNEGVEFHLFTKKNPKGVSMVLGGKSKSPKSILKVFETKLPTRVVVHGWIEKGLSRFGANVKDALLKKLDVNVIVLNWSKHGSYTNYPTSLKKISEVGDILAGFLQELEQQNMYSLKNVHLMGHSLGAHVAGIAGSRLRGKVDRITGFDPAGPFFKEETKDRLRAESAAFVDVIHTADNLLGHHMKMGHVDFYPNGGHNQPGCLNLVDLGVCSHNRAEDYYLESLDNPTGFVGVSCASWDDFKKNKCDYKKINYLGERTDRNVRGNFYFETNKKKPFARGQAGTRKS